jgi:HPt (histidine-containing phosphotransfer) domain-containing protein
MTAAAAIFNVTELLERVEQDRELLRELILIFREGLPAQLNLLRDAVKAKDPEAITRAGHYFKGMFSNLAASRAASAAERLEIVGRNNELAQFSEVLLRLENEIELLLPELESCAAQKN